MIATVMTMRAPGMTWSRLPIFVWGIVSTAILMVLAAPVLVAALLMVLLDRTAQTTFFITRPAGATYLYENLFWVFGHPEVYILALPGMGIVLEILPVFARKPLWGYRLAVAGMLGVTLLELARLAAPPVRQRHQLRPAAVLHALDRADLDPDRASSSSAALRTLWAGQIRFTVPMLFCLAWFFNFLIGGLSGVFLSDVPSDVTTHGSFFSMAHFHYTIMGGLVFAFFAAIYYWVPKMTGFMLNERLGKIHFWLMFIAFNSTFAPLFAIGFLGQPRRVVTYAGYLQCLNDWVSVSAFVLGFSMLIFLGNFVCSLVFARVPAGPNPWDSRSLEWQLPSPVPVHNFDRIPTFDGDPYATGRRRPVPPRPASRRRGRRDERPRRHRDRTSRSSRVSRPSCCGRTSRRPRLWASATAFFFLAFLFAYLYLRSLNSAGLWHPKRVEPLAGVGTLVSGARRRRRARSAGPRSINSPAAARHGASRA